MSSEPPAGSEQGVLPDSLYQGDCLEVLSGFTASAVDLVYIDPPFNTGKRQEAAGGAQEFSDSYGAVAEYVEFMHPRVRELHRVLKPTGTMFLHCDWHASHYLKQLLDEVFGYGCFLNEIIWHYGLGGSSKSFFPRKHDTIFWYAREAGARHTFNPPMVPATSQRMRGQLKKQDDVWDIPSINNMARERVGYPTQKPIELLERIIESASNEGDVVLDAFCGSGTTLVVAHKLGRQFVGVELSETACELATGRLAEACSLNYQPQGALTTFSPADAS